MNNPTIDKLLKDRQEISKKDGVEVWITQQPDEVHLALKFAPELIDRTAHRNKVWGDLVDQPIRFKFNRHM